MSELSKTGFYPQNPLYTILVGDFGGKTLNHTFQSLGSKTTCPDRNRKEVFAQELTEGTENPRKPPLSLSPSPSRCAHRRYTFDFPTQRPRFARVFTQHER